VLILIFLLAALFAFADFLFAALLAAFLA